ncbi:hypothetical protein AZE42_10876 [Rhizopogon vesiculosus]|uniref:Uncharacterized protein n=1 Tax=Rhizopogon vesiculosus TaxID=180088 RepID=A0A1J8QG22_9AGAM|nr:hypothetical protein AZE42_10876 [Rhizopogon vesiculosus]
MTNIDSLMAPEPPIDPVWYSDSGLPQISSDVETIAARRSPKLRLRAALVPRHPKIESIKRKADLQAACDTHGIVYGKKTKLDSLWDRLVRHWYLTTAKRQGSMRLYETVVQRSTAASLSESGRPGQSSEDIDTSIGDGELPREFSVEGGDAEDILGYDLDGLDVEDNDATGVDAALDAFRTVMRTAAAICAEGNRRKGGIKTQAVMKRLWDRFLGDALEKGHVRDDIINEHALLLFIQWNGEICKFNKLGQDLPGTFVGASQIKKAFFGALCLRKVQDAHDLMPTRRRPAVSVRVYDALKTRMDETLIRARE